MARDTIVDRLLHNARARGARPALHYRQQDRWVAMDWATYAQRCREFAGALLGLGYAPGEAVAIVGNNGPEWAIADVGAMVARAVPAGIYPTSTAEQVAYVAGHCEARVAVVEDRAQWDKLARARAELPRLEAIVMVRDAARVDDPRAVAFDEFCARGRAHAGAVERRLAEIQDADLATLIYTSGTTGPPKGAMLSHGNLAFTARAAVDMNAADERDAVVSYLPLSHIAEQMFTIHIALTAGYEVWFAEGLDRLKDALLAARPTLFLAVPRVWEKFKAALEARLAAAPAHKAAIVRWARGVGLRAGEARLERGRVGGLLGVQYRLADRLFYRKLAAQLGLDRLRVAVTGAAPIGRDVLEFFLSCGIPIHEVYGQTEGTGCATFNQTRPGWTRLGTVGRAFPGIELRLAEDGEILVRGPNVFLGYFKDEAATRATLVDGWLHTGDVGELDADGFVRITDRKKDLIITSGGKNVAPQNIEKLLRGIEGIGQAVVVGDRRNYLTALLTLEPERAPALARARGWPTEPRRLATHPDFLAYVQAEVDRINEHLARYETIKRFVALPEDFSQETGELTPTQKVRRKVVFERYAREIEGMYAATDAPAAAPARD